MGQPRFLPAKVEITPDWCMSVFPPSCCRFNVSFLVLQLEDLAKVSIKGQVVQAAKIPTSNAYRRGDTPGSRSR